MNNNSKWNNFLKNNHILPFFYLMNGYPKIEVLI